jgi:hypothetical protein
VHLPRGSQVTPNEVLRGIAGNDNSGMLAELKALRREVAQLRAASEKTADNTGSTAKGVDQLHRTTRNGQTSARFATKGRG